MAKVRDSNVATVEAGKEEKIESTGNPTPPGIQVTHGNAPLLTVKFLELIFKELEKMNKLLEDNG